ncbi:MAG: Universal protein YeaZ [Microgenomates group bacterium GW2011_GWA1_48_10]|nr:MAG: Universal protein YeaZ [Microgenomates group bacterium GW2011_GWA1_48_10]
MKLHIDTSSNQKTTIRLDDQELVRESGTQHSQVVLPMIMELLKAQSSKLQAITEIEVNPGPGSFTGLRVGAAIANALGYALKIPVNGKRPWEMQIVEPVYE